ncbi:MAG: hypothetical protein RID09_27995 [Coleofasciculus sp. G1-WW12-02]|uniref:hypothetical protein n=1 Tax=Coleofasciculus sp. G1-WW12-02 TaxID=3068483 RepID=UPI0032F0BAA5
MTNEIDSAIFYAVELLSHYGFELRGYSATELVEFWLEEYPAQWIRLAVIEALYQGRYKAISVEQILAVWGRREQPIYRFNHEFERLICRKLPQDLNAPVDRTSESMSLMGSFLDRFESSSTVEVAQSEEFVVTQSATESVEALPQTPAQTETEMELTGECDRTPPDLTSPDHTSLPEPVDGSRREAKQHPIDQFTPLPDDSDFYLKLKQVAHPLECQSSNTALFK